MKMKKVVCLILTAIMFSMPLSGLAQEMTMTASVEGKEIYMEGMLDVAEEKEFIIRVLQDGVPSILTAENLAIYLKAMEQGKSALNGSFDLRVYMGKEIPSGKYVITLTKVGSKTVDKTMPFYYLSTVTEQKAIVDDFNKLTTAQELKKFVFDQILPDDEEMVNKLNLDLVRLSSIQNDTIVFEKMLAQKPLQTLTDIQQTFQECIILTEIAEANSGLDAIQLIKNYAGVTKLDWTGTEKLDDLEALGTMLQKGSFSSLDAFREGFYEAVCACAFNQGIRSDMEELIEAYQNKLDLPKAYDLASETERANLYKDLEAADEFTSYKDIGDYITDWFDDEPDGMGGGSGGGGFGGAISGNGGLGTGLYEEPETKGENPNSSSALTPATRFQDLQDAVWAVEAIEYLTNHKIVSGVSETAFEPNRAITREEFVKILVEAFSLSANNGQLHFADVEKSAWYAPYVCAGVEHGIVQGISETHFGVGNTITRQDMATLLYRTLEKLGYTLTQTGEMPAFTDAADMADYAVEGIKMLCEAGVMNGVSQTEFDPQGSATRAMAAKVIYFIIKDLA